MESGVSKVKPRYNSHYGSYSKNRYYDALKTAKNTPTAKQKKFFASLCAKCVENGIDAGCGHPLNNRIDYASGISLLLERLQNAGINVHGNGKEFTKTVTVGMDERGRDVFQVGLKERSFVNE